MKTRMTCSFALCLALGVAGCGGGGGGGGDSGNSGGNSGGSVGGSVTPTSVEIFISLGSLQCYGGGTTPGALQSGLSAVGVTISAQSCGNDGQGAITLCGASDGQVAIFTISSTGLVIAEALGFKKLSTAPGVSKTAC